MELPREALEAVERGDPGLAARILREQTGLSYAEAEEMVEVYLAERGSPLTTLPPNAVQYLLAGKRATAARMVREHFGIDGEQARRLVENWKSPSGRSAEDLALTRLWVTGLLATGAALVAFALAVSVFR